MRAKIADLERRLQDEKNYATDLFIQGEVQKSCARALIKYEHVISSSQNQQQQRPQSSSLRQASQMSN